jgi:hypothetical protein
MSHEGSELFDPLLVKVFVNTIGTYPLGTVVKLDSGEIGIVYRRNPNPSQVMRPLVKLLTDELGMPIEPRISDLSEWDRKNDRFARSIAETVPPSTYFDSAQDFADLL